jgi:hypothetical protein
MKLEEKTLDRIMDSSKLTLAQMILLNCKFWISKEYTEFPEKHYFFEVIHTQVLTEDTILFCTEEQFLKYNL